VDFKQGAASVDQKVAVLVVEDDARIRRALHLWLLSFGYQVTVTASVAEGAEHLDGQAIALLDLQLSDGTADELIRTIRQRALPMRIAVMTAGAPQAVIERLNDAPPDRFFTRPLDIDELADWMAQKL
jgi:CheY-like chemotaxis protein